MGNQQQDCCSVLLTPTKLPDDTRCDTQRLHVYELLPPSPVARILRWQHAALYGNFKRKPWVHGAPIAGWTVIVITIKCKKTYQFTTRCKSDEVTHPKQHKSFFLG